MKTAATIALCAAAIAAAPALAFDGWHLENATTIDNKTATYDYIAFDAGTKMLYLGHRKEGLQVFDPATHRLVRVIADTPAHSANGATLMPEFDLGVSNNEDGTLTPFKISTGEARAAIQIAKEIDTSHYDPASKRLVVNVDAGADGTDLAIIAVPSLEVVGHIKVKTRKAEGADADGAGGFYLAEQDLGKVVKLDTAGMKVTAEWDVPGCAKPTGIAVDPAGKRVFVGCRGSDKSKPALVVLNSDTGAVVFSTEIGEGNDGVVYDAGLQRIFASNGIGANINIIEQTDADHYKLVETLGTRAWVKVLAMDHAARKLYSMAAEGSSDTGKKIIVAVSPFYYNTVSSNTFTIFTFSR